MKYLLMIYMDPEIFAALSEEERDAVLGEHDVLHKDLRESGELVGMAALAEPASTRTVRVRGTAPAVTDGPYVEAKEYLAGFYVVDCASPERAAELGARIPDARLTAVEVRPLLEESGLDL
jgi:hypothetical protein